MIQAVRSLIALALLAAVLPAKGQSTTPTRLTFDVATIKLSAADSLNGYIKALPGGNGYTAHNITVEVMISLMYQVPLRQITGGPEWLHTARYDVEAKIDGQYTIDDLHTMYQSLLADRFGLKFHLTSKEGNIFLLALDKPGGCLTPNTSSQDFNIPITYTSQGIVAHRASMKYLSWWLGQQLQREQRPVVDHTGLAGFYDFALTYQPDKAPDATPSTQPERPNLVEAIHDQLGLKLERQKGPVELYAIDHIDRPSPN